MSSANTKNYFIDFMNRLKRKIQHCIYFLRFQLSGSGKNYCGAKCCFQVPVSRRFSYGYIEIGRECIVGWPDTVMYGSGEILLQAKKTNSCIKIGARCHINNNVFMTAQSGISIGNDCLIGFQCVFSDSDMHNISVTRRHFPAKTIAPIVIGDNVWIGARCFICKGVHIGKNSVIGANSVVTSDIPENVVAAGIPAKVIKTV